MSVTALELNDVGISLAHEGEVTPPSPGYASFGRAGASVGEAARGLARLEPHAVSNRFWHELDDQPLPVLAAAGRSNADLAFEHLSALYAPMRGRAQSVVAVVPGSIQARQLMLLLGIARAAEIPLSGFLDAGVVAASAWAGQGRFIYVDVHLHEAVLTAVEVGTEARRERFEAVPRAGLSALQELWMKLIASTFIARTRFDPLHEARSEQSLFETLPQWLAQLRTDGALEAEIPLGGETHRVPLTRELIENEAQPLYGQILMAAHRLRRAGHATTLALSERAAEMPGLVERFAEFHDCDLVTFAPGAVVRAAAGLELPWALEDEMASLIRSAPLLQGEAAANIAPTLVQRAQAAGATLPPTHALYRGLAHALSPRALLIGTGSSKHGVNLPIAEASAGISRLHCTLVRSPDGAQVIDHSRYGTWLNDERVVSRAPLRAGDRLRVGSPGVAIELIAIE
jgi:hypothetical protein